MTNISINFKVFCLFPVSTFRNLLTYILLQKTLESIKITLMLDVLMYRVQTSNFQKEIVKTMLKLLKVKKLKMYIF